MEGGTPQGRRPGGTHRKRAPGIKHNATRARVQQARQAHARQQQLQIGEWMRQFDTNQSGRLERSELGTLLAFLHPEVGHPSKEALDLLLTQATEIRTYSMHVRGNPNGSVGSVRAPLHVTFWRGVRELPKMMCV